MVSLRDEAEVLALGLELGVVRPSEVVEWADQVIAERDRPHWSFGELVTAHPLTERDAIGLLREVPGTPDWNWARAEVLRLLARRVEDDPTSASHALSVLARLADEHRLPDDLERLAYRAHDALSAIDLEDEAETERQLTAFRTELARWRAAPSDG